MYVRVCFQCIHVLAGVGGVDTNLAAFRHLCVVFFVQQEVMSASVSGNLDAPEGGFDAIMQAVACEVWQCC